MLNILPKLQGGPEGNITSGTTWNATLISCSSKRESLPTILQHTQVIHISKSMSGQVSIQSQKGTGRAIFYIYELHQSILQLYGHGLKQTRQSQSPLKSFLLSRGLTVPINFAVEGSFPI